MGRTDTAERRETMIFHAVWLEQINSLDDAERLEMLEAVLNYGLRGTEPNFTGFAKSAWLGMKSLIDADRTKYEERCEQNRVNGAKGGEFGYLGGRPRKKPKTPNGLSKTPNGDIKTPNGLSKTPKTPDIDYDYDNDNDLKESILKDTKEKNFSLKQSKKNPDNFKNWTEEEFKSKVFQHSEYSEHHSSFIAYWTEKGSRGRMRFQSEKFFEVKKRLATWANRSTSRNSYQQTQSQQTPQQGQDYLPPPCEESEVQ